MIHHKYELDFMKSVTYVQVMRFILGVDLEGYDGCQMVVLKYYGVDIMFLLKLSGITMGTRSIIAAGSVIVFGLEVLLDSLVKENQVCVVGRKEK